MNTNLISPRPASSFSSVLNGLVTGAFTLAVIGIAGVLTVAQYLAVA